MNDFGFSTALEGLKGHYKLSRREWSEGSSLGTFTPFVMMAAYASGISQEELHADRMADGSPIERENALCFFDGKITPWTPTFDDMMAEDWYDAGLPVQRVEVWAEGVDLRPGAVNRGMLDDKGRLVPGHLKRDGDPTIHVKPMTRYTDGKLKKWLKEKLTDDATGRNHADAPVAGDGEYEHGLPLKPNKEDVEEAAEAVKDAPISTASVREHYSKGGNPY